MKISDLKTAGHPFGNIEFVSRQVVEGFITGLHQSPYHGFSVEFAEHRQYNTSESTRHIDWKVYAKTDRLFVKRYEEETNLRCVLLLDVSSSMYYPVETLAKFKFSVLSAAAIAQMLQKQRDAFGLVAFDTEIVLETPIKSTSTHLHDVYYQLSGLYNRKPILKNTQLVSVLHQIAEKVHKRSLIVLFSDMFEDMTQADALFDALKHFKHRQHEVLVFHIKDKNTEDLLAFEERTTVFIDSETGAKVTLNPMTVKDSYRDAVSAYAKNLRLRCGSYKIDYIEVDAADDFRNVLLPFLIKRSKM